jgi:hypothetical protein
MALTMKVRGTVKQILESSIDAALLGVEVYNKPRTSFRSQNFVVLMVIAWTRLFHAYFRKTIGDKYYYKRGGKYEIRDGERRAWELNTCVDKYGKLSKPVEANLKFFINLRNKIEHRTTLASETDTLIFGECQSLLHNYEAVLEDLFGPQYALHESLVFSLQFSRLRKPQQNLANKSALGREAQDILDYIAKYRSALPEDVYSSQEFSVKLICVPRISNTNRQDLAIEFVKWSELNEDDRRKCAKLNAIIKERVVEKERVVVKETRGTIRVVDSTSEDQQSGALVIRPTTDPQEAAATLVYETLSTDLFDDVNKILQANALLSRDNESFKFDHTIYYRVYAARDSLRGSDETAKMLAVTGLRLYGPCLFWLTLLSDAAFSEVLKEFVAVPKFPRIKAALTIAILLGGDACTWVDRKLEASRGRNTAMIDDKVIGSLRKMVQMSTEDDCRLAAIQKKRSSEIIFPDKSRVKITQLLGDHSKAIASLATCCQKVSAGSKDYRTACRLLDVLVYGGEIEKRGYRVIKLLAE